MLAGRNYSIKKEPSYIQKEIEVPRKFLQKAHIEIIKEPFVQYSVYDDDLGGDPIIIVRDFYNKKALEERYYIYVENYGDISNPKIEVDFAQEVKDLMHQLALKPKNSEEKKALKKYMKEKSLTYQKINDALHKISR